MSIYLPKSASIQRRTSLSKFFGPYPTHLEILTYLGQTLIVGVVGQESYAEYKPLIAGGLLRVRMVVCMTGGGG